jgi:2-dehydro-3-deoxyglucarate aldolase
MVQIESIKGVDNVEEILANDDVDGVMIGPMDLSGSLGVPGQTQHPDVLAASRRVIEACEKAGVSCGTQISDPDAASVERLFAMGHTYAILGSDLFSLTNWTRSMMSLMEEFLPGAGEAR